MARRDYHQLLPRLTKEINRKFDEQSGLAYTEVVSKAAPMRADWVWKSRGSFSDVAMYRSRGPGCSTLQDMAIRSACRNVLSLTPESLESLDWQVGQRLWRSIVAYEINSLYVWRVFAVAYPDVPDKDLQRRFQVVASPNMAFTNYVKPLLSASMQWITFLTLSGITCSRLDLINISKLSNIGTLTIGEGVEASDGGLDDSIVRAWARAATECDAFSMLRVLACRKQQSITPQIFLYISQIPPLLHFLLEDCCIGFRDRSHAEASGWKYRTSDKLGEFLNCRGSNDPSWDSIMHACYRHNADLSTGKPILHFLLGKPLTRDDGLRCFYRNEVSKEAPQPPTATKREFADSSPDQSCSRKAIKISKQRKDNDLMTDFGF